MTTQALTTNVAITDTTSTIVLSPNQNRDGFILFNPTGVVYIKFSKYASSSSFTFRLTKNSCLEHYGHIGYVSAIAHSGNSSDVVVTELI